MKNFILRNIFLLCCVAGFTSCTQVDLNEGNAMTSNETRSYSEREERALELGGAYIAQNFPDFDPTDKKLVISAREDRWVVTYELPIYMLGGAPVVEIDMKSGEIIKVYRTQ